MPGENLRKNTKKKKQKWENENEFQAKPNEAYNKY